MIPSPNFDQLYVVSDLHLGGEKGFQIFGSTDAMVWLIRDLAVRDADQEIALLINGDFIDFLAESDPRYFDTFGAIAKLERIVEHDPVFQPIFAALRDFLARPRRRLIVNLGNHDLELALPWVRRRLVELLAGPDADKSDGLQRLDLVMDGTGVACTVGGRSVLCLHGNEVDRWNPADFEKIREIGRDVQLGRPVETWIPNAGTQLVIDVMNAVKRSFPFVDLLKPEKGGVVPVLAACDPARLGSLTAISNAVGALGHLFSAKVRKPRGMLGADAVDDGVASSTIPVSGPLVRRSADEIAEEMMAAVEESIRTGVDPMDLVEFDQDRQLGTVGALRKWAAGESGEEVLREKLDILDADRSFDPLDYDDTARALDKEVSSAIDFLLAGHTHLERALPRRNGRGIYFNSGTWARLIRIPPSVRGNADAFAKVYHVLQGGDMQALDAQGGLVMKLNTVVAIRSEATGGASGQLLHVVPVPTAGGFAMQAVPGTTFTRAG